MILPSAGRQGQGTQREKQPAFHPAIQCVQNPKIFLRVFGGGRMGKTDAEDVPCISLNDKHQKLSTRGREQHDLRPKVALLAAAIRVTCGREQITKVGVQNQFILSMHG